MGVQNIKGRYEGWHEVVVHNHLEVLERRVGLHGHWNRDPQVGEKRNKELEVCTKSIFWQLNKEIC